jgi:hypothetical protein
MSKTIVVFCIIMICSAAWANMFFPANNISLPKEAGRLDRVLMILESTTDSLGLYDMFNGTYIRGLCHVTGGSTPINAIQGPEGNIYVSDQVADAVTVYDTTGTYLYTYADATDGLDNVRGIAFRGHSLFVTASPTVNVVKEFSGPHTLVRDFIAGGMDPFDILFLTDGRALLSDMGGNMISLYDTNGTFIRSIISTSFPEQVQVDLSLPGEFLVASFSSNDIKDFDTTGTIVRTLSLTGGPRGVYRLGNGNILATNGTGVHELDSLTGAIIQTKHGGSARFIEVYTEPTAVFETNNSASIKLDNIYPNPFKNVTTIRYNIIMEGEVGAKIYNCLGNEVRTLVNQRQTSGNYSITWNGKDNQGLRVPNGIYICQLKTGNEIKRGQIILIK